jgi:hypothetical protein
MQLLRDNLTLWTSKWCLLAFTSWKQSVHTKICI